MHMRQGLKANLLLKSAPDMRVDLLYLACQRLAAAS